MTQRIKREIYTSRFFRTGNSYAVVIPPDLIDAMGLRLGSTLAMNFQYGVLWVVRMEPHMIVNRDTVSKVFDSLFPDKRELRDNS